ncbi:nitrogen fixation protein NifX [Candidatus Methylospira mobilis]|uniref:Nitrogen fixation protein NifX n=1 Tax=Candidatus Methylospira mobilis TaxID=1808979 RepID=A0A5Q0BFX3_9GAMM|nr:nitrogen fixation protein NifX [Candidatus Methylospira mobilis]QFY42022.1 nitrogen fixation protein NifX [Candidatus Methylospira mobilis]WNV03029.1 nitrogen fixation protein NifX [Candidatus Methylospira mobilis]
MNATAAIMDRDVALRIGLAARVLPDINAQQLVEVLLDKLGAPLTEEKLSLVTVTQLKTGLASPDGEEDTEHLDTLTIPHYKEAVRILWGEVARDDLPKPQDWREGDMPGSIRVAIASNTGAEMDGHFGSCQRYLIYQVGKDEARLIDLRSSEGADESDDRNRFRAELIKDCQILYVVSIGGPAAAKVIKAGIYPMKLAEESSAHEVIIKLQTILNGHPPPWLAKIMGETPATRRRFNSEESWDDE